MCSRYTLHSNLGALQLRFKFAESETSIEPRYNIAPSQDVFTVTNTGLRRLQLMRWGLVPFWAKDIKIGHRMINARSETAGTKPTLRDALRKRRCLILADGFFEWRREGKEKIPTYIFLKSREPLAFAGLWETWRGKEGKSIMSCAILTSEANNFMKPIHNRMPVILDEESEALWLDPMTENTVTLGKLLAPAPSELMDCYQVSNLVNSYKNTDHKVIDPLSPSSMYNMRLFS